MDINKLKNIMKTLRDPVGGCPWDIEQDFKSISPHTIEEAYEVVDAINNNDMPALKEELGDLLLQVIFHSQMASEKGEFSFDDVVESICNKLISRHPHVFGDMEVKTAAEQEAAWEKHKEKERAAKGNQSLLDGVALALPALMRANKLQKRAAKVGFDWPDVKGVFAKIEEEISEVKEAIEDNKNIDGEIGDLIFIVSNLARKLDINPEEALKKCNEKFYKRFSYIEEKLGEKINDASLEEMDRLWEESKKIFN